MNVKPVFTSDERAKTMLERGLVTFTLEPVFPVEGSLESRLVMRYPISMRISYYSFQMEFLLATHILGEAIRILRQLPLDAFGGKPKIYLPIPMRILSDHRFIQILTDNTEFRSLSAWLVLMGTPDSAFFIPDTIDLPALTKLYFELGMKICIGDIHAEHIHLHIIQEGLDSILPSEALEATPTLTQEMEQLKRFASAAAVPMLTHRNITQKLQPWADSATKNGRIDKLQQK